MQKKFLVLFVFAAALFCLYADDGGAKPFPNQPDLNGKASKNELAKYTVANRLFEPPVQKKIHDPSVKEYAGKLKHLAKKKEATSSWGFLHASFPVLRGGVKSVSWGEWLDGVVVTAELIVRSDSKKDSYYVLRGVQKLNPVHADGEVHDVAFFVPPYALHRYYKLEPNPSRNNLKALQEALTGSPVRFTIECGNYKTCIYNYGYMAKNGSDKGNRARIDGLISEALEKKENVVDDCMVDIRETPWVIMGVEFFESVKVDKGGK